MYTCWGLRSFSGGRSQMTDRGQKLRTISGCRIRPGRVPWRRRDWSLCLLRGRQAPCRPTRNRQAYLAVVATPIRPAVASLPPSGANLLPTITRCRKRKKIRQRAGSKKQDSSKEEDSKEQVSSKEGDSKEQVSEGVTSPTATSIDLESGRALDYVPWTLRDPYHSHFLYNPTTTATEALGVCQNKIARGRTPARPAFRRRQIDRWNRAYAPRRTPVGLV